MESKDAKKGLKEILGGEALRESFKQMDKEPPGLGQLIRYAITLQSSVGWLDMQSALVKDPDYQAWRLIVGKELEEVYREIDKREFIIHKLIEEYSS